MKREFEDIFDTSLRRIRVSAQTARDIKADAIQTRNSIQESWKKILGANVSLYGRTTP